MKQFFDWLLRAIDGTPKPPPIPPPPVPPPVPPVPPPVPGDVPAELLAAHNRERAVARLPALDSSVALMVAAQSHADHMARVGTMAHKGIGDGDLGSRLRAVGYGFRSAGENIAMGQRDVAAVMGAWMKSPGHRANILGDFSAAGFAVAYATNGTMFWTAVFGSPMTQSRVSMAPPAYAASTPEVTGDWGDAASSVAIEAYP